MRFTEDTIVAIATPAGPGGIGIIRMSGGEAITIAERVFQPSGNHRLIKVDSHRIVHGRIVGPQGLLDECLALVFLSPHSYTGENIIEFSCHGSPNLLSQVMNLCISQGARPAQPGEFTRRAFENGRMDLAQAEAVADLISARDLWSRRSALSVLTGQFSQFISSVRQDIVRVFAHVEACLDFSQEEISPISWSEVEDKLAEIIRRIDSVLIPAYGSVWHSREGLRVSLVGRSNVGKSSLFNALLRRDRAIVTPSPGTTRDTLEEEIEIFSNHREGSSRIKAVLVDTAGLGTTDHLVEKMGQDRSRIEMERADAVLFVVDSSQPMTQADRRVAQDIHPKKTIVVMNKTDLPARCHSQDVRDLFNGSNLPCIRTSALTGSGLKGLSDKLLEICPSSLEPPEGIQMTRTRHVRALQQTRDALVRAREGVVKRVPEECLSLDLRQSCRALEEITGEGASEELLDSIFSQFCIGK